MYVATIWRTYGTLHVFYAWTYGRMWRELKEMELNHLVSRTVNSDYSGLIEYGSTDYCKSFGPIIPAMIAWSIEHRKMIREK